MLARSEAPESDLARAVVGRDRLTVLTDVSVAYYEMLDAIATARERVRLETYIFGTDRVGARFVEALLDAAARGVDVRLLVDGWGCLANGASFFQRLRRGGVRVLAFNPVSPLRMRFPWPLRDHRKLLLADGSVAFTGSLNIGAELGPDAFEESRHETHVRIEGPTVRELESIFDETWDLTETGRPWHLPAMETREQAGRPSPADARVQASQLRVLRCGTFKDRHQISQVLRALLKRARHRITIINPYFVPRRPMLRELRRACRRGVQVRLMLGGRLDVPPVWYASRALYARLLRWGAEIWLWQGTRLHSKVVVVDESWTTIGTYNFDNFSAFRNLEVAVSVSNRTVAARLEERFDAERSLCLRLTEEMWSRRPLWQKLAERLAYFFRYWL